ncbi:YecA family protein [Neobacillus muris]|uniref:YecA family protein n=1 Tax=Neobacillus muris TaxID=2941334 RepID=UPI00203BCFE9|nr:SEC-C metal-binding domain-containing protein [Neobacillus muris]
MDILQISKYLQYFKGIKLNKDILDQLSEFKKIAVNKGDQEEAKNIWCLEQVYKVINHFLTAYKQLEKKEYYSAWCKLERADIELHFLRRHLDYSGNKYGLEFIENIINQLQKLFPYQVFSSRESTVKKWRCSICNQVISLRNSCGHEIGEIYNGEQCFRIAEDIEFHGIAIVTNPFDKFAVLFPEGKEYNYAMLENLMKNWTNPYDKWELHIVLDLNEEFKGLGRNDPCACNSGEKYKNCCLRTGEDKHEHYKILFLEKDLKNFKRQRKQSFKTWKN